MSKYCFYHFIILLIGAICSEVLCLSCKELKPNANVYVVCAGPSKDPSRCDTNATAIIGTTATYNCENFYESVIRGRDGGTLNCTAEGEWNNYKAFTNFYCKFGCGKVFASKSELISHGNSAIPLSWPWVATIFRWVKDGQYKYTCGGTLIGQRTVLTAAHCVMKEDRNKLPTNIFKIIVGTFSISSQENVEAGVQSFLVKEIHVHPDYNSNSLVADVAIIVLTEAVTLNEAVSPICLPRSHGHNNLAITIGSVGEIASFGTDGTGCAAKVLQHARFPVASISRCHQVINVIPLGDQYCAGSTRGPKICRGDSGSGMVFKSVAWNEEKYSIHGIVSNTGELVNGCAPLFVMTKVYSYIIWIEEIFIPVENLGYLKELTRHPTSTKQTKDKPITGPSLYSRAERQALANVLPMVKDMLLEDYMHKDEYVIRFLRTKRLNLQETKDMLRATMDWRKANRINELLKENFTEFRNDFPAFAEIYDKDGRPVVLSVFRLYDYRKVIRTRKLEKFYRYVLRNFEETEERIRAVGQRHITQSVLIYDFHGLETRKHICAICLRFMVTIFRIHENYYPQQLYLWYVINIPSIAETIFEVLPLVSDHLLSGIRLFGTNKTEWSQELLKQIPADQLFVNYGGTKFIKQGTKRIELAM